MTFNTARTILMIRFYGTEEGKEINKILNEVDENPWHTGKPTENGKYLVQYRTGFMEFLSYRDGKWLAKETAETMWGTRLKTKREDVTDLVVAWREIEPYKEASNGKVSD